MIESIGQDESESLCSTAIPIEGSTRPISPMVWDLMEMSMGKSRSTMIFAASVVDISAAMDVTGNR